MNIFSDRNIRDGLDRLVAIWVALFASMVLVRGIEMFTGAWSYEVGFVTVDYAVSAFVSDFQFSGWMAIVLWFLLSPLLLRNNDKMTNKVSVHLICIIGLIQILLIQYFGATQTPLGAEFWAYSLTEMSNTVIAAEQVTVVGIMFLVGIYLFMYWMGSSIVQMTFIHSDQKRGPIFLGSGVLILLAISLLYSPDADATAAQKEKRTNKLAHFVSRSIDSINWFDNNSLDVDSDEYPLVHQAEEEDVLGPFFEEFDSPPNIVFLLVESLGGEFVGPSGQWTGFAPYLDSLSQKGLYWEHGLSLSGRTFGMMPSLLGALPFGRHGFMELGPNYPNHQSLISILNEGGYHTAFYGGYDTYFDGLNFFLGYQDIDFVLDKQKLEKTLPESKSQSNYWGMDDRTMLNFTDELLDTAQTHPRLEIYHTLQSHSPFTVPDPGKYEQLFNEQLATLDLSQDKMEAYQKYRAELTTLLFADRAIEDFMESYSERDEFENTIFVITGDHWLIPVPQTSTISQYHVPIIIYSPKLKQPVHFKSVNSHAEIVPTLTAMLDQQTDLVMPEDVHWISGLMDTARHFRSEQSIPFMRNKNSISDYLDEEYYLHGDELYELEDGLALTQKDDPEIKERVEKKLNQFKAINNYVVENDKLYPGSSNTTRKKHDFLVKYDTLYSRLDSLGLTIDEQFQRARQAAFDDEYEIARAIGSRILLQHPGYHDVRILVGRTYAWDENYDEAETYFKEVLEADSTYEDAYVAYADNEFWQGDDEKVLDVLNRGLEYHPQNEQLTERKIKVLYRLGNEQQAQQLLEKLEEINPDYENLPELKKYVAE